MSQNTKPSPYCITKHNADDTSKDCTLKC